MRPFILYKTIFILFIFIIEGYTMMDYLTVPEGSTIVIEHPFFSQFEILNEPKILVQQENAIEYFKLIHEILEDIDYTDNYCTKAEEQIEKMNNNINKKLHQNRQKFGDNLWAIVVKLSRFCQRIGLNELNSTQQIENRSFGKKLCRLAMFVALAEFFSIEMKKILKKYVKGIVPRACARILRLLHRTSSAVPPIADGADTAPKPLFVGRAWKVQLLGIYAEIKSNKASFERIFVCMDRAKTIMSEARLLDNNLPHIQTTEITQQLNDLINREHLYTFVGTKVELENNC